MADIRNYVANDGIKANEIDALVAAATKEEGLISTRLVEIEGEPNVSFGQRAADSVAEFGGSWHFILFFGAFIVVWILFNVLWLRDKAVDPYPFILLNLILSCLSALQAPIIMMSQNRQEEKDRKRARSDFIINMKAEIEIRELHEKVDKLMAKLDERTKSAP